APDTALRSITSHAELLTLTDGDPFVRWGLPEPLSGRALATRGAVAVERFGRRGRGLWVFPHSGGAAPAIRDLLGQLPGPVQQWQSRSISLPQEYAEELAAVFDVGDGGDWDWMWTTTDPPEVPREDELVILDD